MEGDKWHFRPEIQIGHILTTIGLLLTIVGMVFSFAYYFAQLEQRVAVLENRMFAAQEIDKLLREQVYRLEDREAGRQTERNGVQR